MLFALAFFIQFLIGGLSGIFVASPVLDYQAYGTYFVVAHFHYTLFAGSIFGFFAGVYHWFPKVTGALLRERLGKLQLRADGGGHEPDLLPDVLPGQRRDAAARVPLPHAPGVGHAQRARDDRRRRSSRSASLMFLVNVFVSLRRRVPAGDDPWLGHTLEWATSSPPPPLNFEAPLPPIRSYAPLLDLRHEEIDRARTRAEVPRGLMRGGAIPILAWGTILLVLALGNWVWDDKTVNGLVATAAVVIIYCVGAGGVAARREAIRRGPPEPRTEPRVGPAGQPGRRGDRPVGGLRAVRAGLGEVPARLRDRAVRDLARAPRARATGRAGRAGGRR